MFFGIHGAGSVSKSAHTLMGIFQITLEQPHPRHNMGLPLLVRSLGIRCRELVGWVCF